MNRVELMGRLTRDPDVRYSQGEDSVCVASYVLAVYCTWEKGRVRRKAPETGNEDRGGREAPVRAL